MKYIDLAPTIKRDRTRGPITGLDGETYTLKWLDDHPDQAPGRTITAAKFSQAVDIAMDSGEFDTDEFAQQLGITIVPDPKPTNLQLLTQAIRDWEEGRGTDRILARHLNALGVKAPEGAINE